MSGNMIIAAEYPSIGSDNTPTFAGILQKYYIVADAAGQNIGISKRWNENTRKAYKSDYENVLLPLMNELLGERKPIRLFSEEDVDLVLGRLKKKRHLTDARTAHYYHLIKSVYMAGVEHGLYTNSLLWIETNDEEIDLSEETERVRVMTRIRKSFSEIEEKRIAEWFLKLDPADAAGEDIGLLLMYFMGLRNNEACGADFENFHALTYHSDIMVFDMLKSTKIGSNQLKAGGKTGNAPRTLIVVKPLADFIQKRYEALKSMIDGNCIKLSDEYKDVSQLPVVCKGTNYLKRADSDSLSEAGRVLFKRIKIDKSELQVMEQIIRNSEFRDVVVDEKEVTTYLFRRNCATHLYNLGFSLSEIQYWMGHEINADGESRNYFADPDALTVINGKIQRHPFLALIKCSKKKKCLKIEDYDGCYFSDKSDREKIFFKGSQDKFLIKLEAREPNQKLEVHIETLKKGTGFDVGVIITSECGIVADNTANTANVQRMIYENITNMGKD